MNQYKYNCQVDIKNNPNTPKFWDANIKNNRNIIIQSPIYKSKITKVVNFIKNKSGKLLDIGIGYGHVEQQISDRNINLKMYGIDISKYSVNLVKKKFEGNFKIASVYNIPHKNNFFNVVIALDILEHLPKTKINLALSEINRVMRQDGKLIITIPINENKTDRFLNGHLRKYNINIINKELDSNKFDIEYLEYLYAFKNMYTIKNLINNLFNFKRPNLIFLVCKKK